MVTLIRTIPHHRQRYPTCGDWWATEDQWNIRVSALGDWRYEFLVSLHEQIEMALCVARGISEDAVTTFDEAHPDADSPGDLLDAPYRREHRFAENLERLMAAELGVDWDTYDRIVGELP